MTTPTIGISMAFVDVPVPPPPPRRRKDEPHPSSVSLEIWSTYCRVWDQVSYTQCGELYPYTRKPDEPLDRALYGDRQLTDIPHFDLVFAYLVSRLAANRTNPLGAFLRPAVEAMEAAAARRDGTSVYFARVGDRIKIGWSRKVGTRLAQLQTGNAAPVELLATQPGGRTVERRLHEMFAAARVSGEWFAATPDLLAHIADLRVIPGGAA